MENPILKLTTEIESGRHEWILTEDWHIRGYTVPKGFKTDLGSIPRIFWSVVGPQEIARGAILHDWLYDQRVEPRGVSDKILRSLILDEVGRFRANLVYYAVRLFGGQYYGLDRRY